MSTVTFNVGRCVQVWTLLVGLDQQDMQCKLALPDTISPRFLEEKNDQLVAKGIHFLSQDAKS